MTCVIIGNGTSVLDSEHGARIDGCETVVRFNLYQTKGYEKYVGEKTSVWFCGMAANGTTWRLEKPYREIFAHSWEPKDDRCKVLKSFREALPEMESKKVSHLALKAMDEFANTSYKHWSTGAIGIWHMLRDHERVAITGFDWWEGRIRHHYFNPASKMGVLHKPEIEKAFVDKLIDEGKVSFLGR